MLLDVSIERGIRCQGSWCGVKEIVLFLFVGLMGCRSPLTANFASSKASAPPVRSLSTPTRRVVRNSFLPQAWIKSENANSFSFKPLGPTDFQSEATAETATWSSAGTAAESTAWPHLEMTRSFANERDRQFDGKFKIDLDPLASGSLVQSTVRMRFGERILQDHLQFYSPETMTMMAGGLVVGAAVANTSLDDGIHRHFQSSIRGATSDDWFESLHASKELGNGRYTLPLFAVSWATGELLPDNELAVSSGRWGERSIRAFAVGAPPLILMQQLTGGSRPGETDENSEWHPLRDNNGISGHAFMGALPFITAAMMTESRGLKMLFYAGSTIAPLSRVNDSAHYPSQVILGWWMSYLAASAIDATENPNAQWKFYPYSTGDSSGVKAEYRF